jgi:hypothetical protein
VKGLRASAQETAPLLPVVPAPPEGWRRAGDGSPLLLPPGTVAAAGPYPRPGGGAATADAPADAPSWWRLSAAASWLTADRLISAATAISVGSVASFAAVVSYNHIYALARLHGETGVEARLLPLSVDGVIAEASLVMLSAARRGQAPSRLARFMLWGGITATVAANVAFGLPAAWISPVASAIIGALLSAWPAGAFIGSVEMAIGHVKTARQGGTSQRRNPLRHRVKGHVTAAGEGPSAGDGDVPAGVKEASLRGEGPRPARVKTGGTTRQVNKAKASAGGATTATDVPSPRRGKDSSGSSSDAAIEKALSADPSLHGKPHNEVATAAGVSRSSVERYRRKLRAAR